MSHVGGWKGACHPAEGRITLNLKAEAAGEGESRIILERERPSIISSVLYFLSLVVGIFFYIFLHFIKHKTFKNCEKLFL